METVYVYDSFTTEPGNFWGKCLAPEVARGTKKIWGNNTNLEQSGAIRSNLEQSGANIWDQAETIGSGTTKSHMPKKYNRLKLVLRQNKN